MLCTSGFVDDVMIALNIGLANGPEWKLTRMFRPVRQVAAAARCQTTLFGGVRQGGGTGIEVCRFRLRLVRLVCFPIIFVNFYVIVFSSSVLLVQLISTQLTLSLMYPVHNTSISCLHAFATPKQHNIKNITSIKVCKHKWYGYKPKLQHIQFKEHKKNQSHK